MTHLIRIGVGGWSFEPWDETFYPPGLSKSKQLEYASRKMTAVEVNATYYSSFKPETFAKWRDATPDGYVFSLKAHRFSTVRKTREDMKKSIDLFLGQGITQLKEKLGPINWQFPPTRRFEREYFDMFLSQLPKEKDKIRLRHVLEVRHPSCNDPAFPDLLTKHGATVVYAEDDEFPKIRHEDSDFVDADAERPASRLSEDPDRPVREDVHRMVEEAGCLRVLHFRRQGAQSSGGDGASGAPRHNAEDFSGGRRLGRREGEGRIGQGKGRQTCREESAARKEKMRATFAMQLWSDQASISAA
jgi:uncharacterized protein YecE (DUF72 family)